MRSIKRSVKCLLFWYCCFTMYLISARNLLSFIPKQHWTSKQELNWYHSTVSPCLICQTIISKRIKGSRQWTLQQMTHPGSSGRLLCQIQVMCREDTRVVSFLFRTIKELYSHFCVGQEVPRQKFGKSSILLGLREYHFFTLPLDWSSIYNSIEKEWKYNK